MKYEVLNQKFYHVNSGDKRKIGDILVFNQSINNKMYEAIYNNEYKINNMDANELVINKKRNKINQLTDDELELILNTLNNDAFVLREIALEKYRSENYPNYPSRLHCLYVTPDKEDSKKWIKILKRNNKVCNQILTFELIGDLYVFDGGLMYRLNQSFDNYLKNAKEYWDKADNLKEPEYLFYGQAKVVDVEDI